MPVLGVGRTFYRISLPKYLNGFALLLVVADPFDRYQSLPARMRMPVRSRTRLEGDAGDGDVKNAIRIDQGMYKGCSGKIAFRGLASPWENRLLFSGNSRLVLRTGDEAGANTGHAQE